MILKKFELKRKVIRQPIAGTKQTVTLPQYTLSQENKTEQLSFQTANITFVFKRTISLHLATKPAKPTFPYRYKASEEYRYYWGLFRVNAG